MRILLGGTILLVGYTGVYWGWTRLLGGNTNLMTLIVPARKNEYYMKPKPVTP